MQSQKIVSEDGSGSRPLPGWPTPIYVKYNLGDENFRERLAILIENHLDPLASPGLSNRGGKRTRPDFLLERGNEVDKLRGWIAEAASTLYGSMLMAVGASTPTASSAFKVEAWGNIYGELDSQLAHGHHDSMWSGVYYATVPESEASQNSGVLNLYDPRPAFFAARLSHDPDVVTIVPEPGLLVAFPSWLLHSVSPHKSKTARICVAFNAKLTDHNV